MTVSRRSVLACLAASSQFSGSLIEDLDWLNAAESQQLPGDRLFSTPLVAFHLEMSERQFANLMPARPRPGFGPPGFGGPGFGGRGPEGAGFGPPTPPRTESKSQPATIPSRATPDKLQTDATAANNSVDTHRNTFGIEFPWSSGQLRVNDQSYSEVGIRYKGNYTYMAAARSLKKSLKLDLNRHKKGQKLDGLTMLNLHSGVSDPTRIRESFAYGYFREAQVPAPRTTFAQFSLTVPGIYTDEFVGVYTLVEQVNKAFLKRHFADSTGMLLKPEGLRGGLPFLGDRWPAYSAKYQPEDEPQASQQQRLIEFTRLIHESSDSSFVEQAAEYLDVDAFLRFIAANALLANLDSYLGYGHNFYLYLQPTNNRFVFIPWDLDLSLATWPAAGTPEQLVELSIHHPHAGENRLIDRLFAVEKTKQRYLAIVNEQLETTFTSDKMVARVEALEAVIGEPLKAELRAVAARQENAGAGAGFGNGQFGQSMPPLRFIRKRLDSVKRQLAGEATGFVPRVVGPR
ncbi:MAG: CotH kinase family protein [Pirellulales bacterium]